MAACLDFNLPCVDVGPFVLDRLNISTKGVDSSGDGVKMLGSVEYYVVTWVRPIVVLELLKRGYTVHSSGEVLLGLGFIRNYVTERELCN